MRLKRPLRTYCDGDDYPPLFFALAFVVLIALPESRAANPPGAAPASTNASTLQSSPAAAPRVGVPAQPKPPTRIAAPPSLPDTPENRLAGYRALKWDVKKQGGFVMSMCTDLRGRVYLGTEDDAVWRYDPLQQEGWRWTHYTTRSGLGDDYSYALDCDMLGRTWVGHLNHGVSVFNGQYWRNYGVTSGPLGSRIFAIAVCPTDGSVWMASDVGLARYSIKEDTWSYFTRSSCGLCSDQADALAFNNSGDIFVGTQCDGIAIGRSADGYRKWTLVRGPDQMPNTCGGSGLPTNLINCLLVSRKTGTVYAGTTTGLARSEDDGKTWRYLRGVDWEARVRGLYQGPEPGRFDTHGHILSQDYVTSLAEDDTGMLWIGHRSKGFEVVSTRSGEPVFARQPAYVRGILPLGHGMAIVATYGQGVLSFELAPGAGGTPDLAASMPGPARVNSLAVAGSDAVCFPSPAKAPTAEDLYALKVLVSRPGGVAPSARFLGDDWSSQGDWIRGYGREFGVLWAADAPWNNVFDSSRPLTYACHAQLGPHCDRGDEIRHYITFLTSTDQRVLYDPVVAVRRQAEIDDHGESYSITHEGPDLWITVEFPEGFHEISLYFYNKDGHDGDNRFRDYLLEIRRCVTGPSTGREKGISGTRLGAYSEEINDAAAVPVLARARVRDFWGGVYKRFSLVGPGRYWCRVHKIDSLNTICSGIFLDTVGGPLAGAAVRPMAGSGYNYERTRPDLIVTTLENGAPARMDHLDFKTVLVGGPTVPPVVQAAAQLWSATDSALASGSPPASAADVQLVVQGPGGRATCTVLGSDAGSGIIAFKIAGTSASPNPTPAGDTTLSALMGGNVVGSAAVLVVVPQFVTPADATAQYLSTGYPGAQSPASVPWQGAALNNTTSPADTQATAPMVDLDVTATIPEPVYVFDQFQSPLNAVYNGDVVSEQDGEGNNVPINQNVYNGAYTDPVGYLLMSGTTVDSSTPAGQAQIQQWLNSPAVGTLVLGNLPGSVYVTIAGEPLSELVNGTTSPFVRREVVCAGSTQNSLLLYIRHI